jgi:HAE1 family hydrophobic/amphiphilic exporter-1
MFGFVLAIGIVVDDAIIVVEAVQHYIDEQHMSPKEATYHAMKEISAPVVAIALDPGLGICAGGFYTRYCGEIVSAVCYYHCYIGYVFGIYCAIINTSLVYLAVKAHQAINKKSNWLDKFFSILTSG